MQFNPGRGFFNRFSVILILALILTIVCSQSLLAVPACPEESRVKQPDGTEISIFLRGDERFHWNEDSQGYLITRGRGGKWVFAVQQDSRIAETSYEVGKHNGAALGLAKPDLGKFKAAALENEAQRQAASSQDGGAEPVPITGVMKNLVVLVNFSDLSVAYSAANYESLFNQIGYMTDGAAGSVKDFYLQVSYGQLTVESTVVEPVMLANGYAYYGANDSSGDDVRPREMVRDALAALEARGFDFRTVDGDGDGWVDGLTVIHAGGGEEYSGNNPDYIWSHKWDMISQVTYDGTKMRTYHTEPARRGWDSSSSSQGITRIGVICHENGHFLGLPDLYDYGGDSYGAGKFCLMAGGSWNGNYGTRPAHPSAWCKVKLNWVSATEILYSGTYSAPRVEDNQVKKTLIVRSRIRHGQV